MTEPINNRDLACKVIKNYYRGMLGPSGTWVGLASVLTPENATAVLESLPDDMKQKLLDLYFSLPPHAYIVRNPNEPQDEDFNAVCVQVVRWCEQNGHAPELPSEPDGIIRVRVEGNLVCEWRPWDSAP